MSYTIIINRNSGTVQRKGIDYITRQIHETLDGQVDDIFILPPEEISGRIAAVKQHADNLLIGGGDGTIMRAARQLYPDKKPFGVLPLGTINLFARDLGISPDFTTALTQYWQAEKKYIDVGRVNDKIFLCNAIFGVVPEATKAREQARRTGTLASWSNILTAVMRGFDRAHRQKITLQGDTSNLRKTVNSVIVANNSYEKNPQQADDRLHRPTLTGGKLAIYIARPTSIFDSVRLIARVLTGGWIKDPSIDSFETRTLNIGLADSDTLLTLDGEIEKMKTPLQFTIEPQTLPVLIPKEAAHG